MTHKFIVFYLLAFLSGTGASSMALTISAPRTGTNQFYDVCSSSSNRITCYFNDTAAPSKIIIPRGGCLLHADGSPSGITPIDSSDFYVYSNVTAFDTFQVDLSTIDCKYFSYINPPSYQRIYVIGISGIVWADIPLNQPHLEYSSPFADVKCTKGKSYSRKYQLKADKTADYHDIRVDAAIEPAFFVSSVFIRIIDSTGTVVDSLQRNIDTLQCEDIPDRADRLISNVVQRFSLQFSNASSGGAIIPLPVNFSKGWKIEIRENFFAISLDKNNAKSTYSWHLNNCSDSLNNCGTVGTICDLTELFYMNSICDSLGKNHCLNYFAGDLSTATTDSTFDIYDSIADFSYRILIAKGSVNENPEINCRRLFDCQFLVDTRYFSIPSTNDVEIGSLDSSGTYYPLTTQPSIYFSNDVSDMQRIVVCFKSIQLGIDPDGAGPLQNIYPNPANTADSAQYKCDLPGGNSLLVHFRNIQFNDSNSTLHSCTYTPISFIKGINTNFVISDSVDLCTEKLRQYHPDTTHARCDISNVPLATIKNEGYISGSGDGNHVFAGNFLSQISNTDIVQSPSNPYQKTQVHVTFSFDKTFGISPWDLSGPLDGCSPTYTHSHGIINQHGEVYFARIMIPAGFRIVPDSSGVWYRTIELNTDSTNLHFDSLNFHANQCNTYELVLPSVSSSISFLVTMDGCPASTDSSPCTNCGLHNQRNARYGALDICAEFCSQLNDAAHHLSNVLDTAVMINMTYGCGFRTIYYHCTDECTGDSPISTDFAQMERNSFGYPSDSLYLSGAAPFTFSQSEEGKSRLLIGDDLIVRSEGDIKIIRPCTDHLSFQLLYGSVADHKNYMIFDSGRFDISVDTGSIHFQLALHLDASNLGSMWDVSLFNPYGNNDSSYLTIRLLLDSIRFQDSTSSVSDTLLYDLLRHYFAKIRYTGHYHISCQSMLATPTLPTVAPGAYQLSLFRGQFTITSSDSTCNRYSCDDWGAPLEAIVIKNTLLYSFMEPTGSVSNTQSTSPCALRLFTGIVSEGGYGKSQDFRGEYRPIVRYPMNFGFRINNNLYLDRVLHTHSENDAQSTGEDIWAYNIAGACSPSNQYIQCPDSNSTASPLNPGGLIQFHYDTAAHKVVVNGDTLATGRFPSNVRMLVQAKGQGNYFTYYLMRTCLDSGVQFAVDSIYFPAEFFNSYTEYKYQNLLQNKPADSIFACATSLPDFDSAGYFSYVNKINENSKSQIQLNVFGAGTDGSFLANGNTVKFCAQFSSGIRAGWVYCPNDSILSIRKTNGCTTSAGSSYMDFNDHGLFYFDCNASNPQSLEFIIQFPCTTNASGTGYETTPIEIRYGVFCNRCLLHKLNPASPSDLNLLTSCGEVKSIIVPARPAPITLNLTSIPVQDSVPFCDSAVIQLPYILNNTSSVSPLATLYQSTLVVTNDRFGATGEAFHLKNGLISYTGTSDSLNHTINFQLDTLFSGSDTLTFSYFPGCEQFDNTAQFFSFRIQGLNSCDDTIASLRPASNEGSAEFVSGTSNDTIVFKMALHDSLYISGNSFYCSGGSTLLTAHPSSIAYQWYRNGIPIVGANSQTVSAQAGIYHFVATLPECSRCHFNSSSYTVIENTSCCDTVNRVELHTRIDSISSFGNNNYSLNGNLVIATGRSVVFNHSDVIIAPGVILTVDSGASLRIENHSWFHACSSMWSGILVNPGGTLTIDSSMVSDADTAVRNAGGWESIIISGSSFSSNYTGISLNQNDGSHATFAVHGSYFNGGPLLKAPHDGEYAFTGIYLNESTEIRIGDEKEGQNVFSELRSGIYAQQSSFNAINSRFQNMTFVDHIGPKLYPAAYGIFAIGDNSTTDYQIITIGGQDSTFGCEFRNCLAGIYAIRNISPNIEQNKFWIDSAFDNSSVATGIICGQNTKVAAHVPSMSIHKNIFNNYSNGINVYASDYGFTIDSNIFNKDNWNLELLNHTAIQVRNTAKHAENEHYIKNNNIYQYQNGILTTFLNHSQIEANTISYHTTTDGLRYGIKCERGYLTTILNNMVYNDHILPTNKEKSMYGISVESSVECVVSDNETTNMGTGVRFFNSRSPNTAHCNRLHNCVAGVTLERSDIGDQGDSLHPANNMWSEPLNSTHANIVGYGTGAFSRPTWWVRNFPGFNPDINNTNSAPNLDPPGVVFLNDNAELDYYDCSYEVPCDDLAGLPCWQLILYNMSERTGAYSGFDDGAYRDMCMFVYRQLNEDNSLMELGTGYDEPLQEFYNNMEDSNIGELIEIANLIESNDTVQAALQNSNFTPSDVSEENTQIVNDAFLKTWAVEFYEFDQDLENMLLNVAYQNPINGGEAVYEARVMLDLDLLDFYEEGYGERLAGPGSFISRVGYIVPNPSNGTMKFIYHLVENLSSRIEIFDTHGHLITRYELPYDQSQIDIDMNEVACGVYFYRVTSGSNILFSDKIVINK